jgi:hypothetical protein
VAALVGASLRAGDGHRFLVAAVDAGGVRVRTSPWAPATVIARRELEDAVPFVATGRSPPLRGRSRAARAVAVLRAIGVGP